MKKRFYIQIIYASIFVFLMACSGESGTQLENYASDKKPVRSEDPEENHLENEAEEGQRNERIVATTVAITEFMDILEMDLVGVPSSYKDLPERYAGVTEIGNPMWPDMEILMSLKPTDVLSVTTLQADLEEDFKKVNVPATFLNLESVSSMLDEIEKLGYQYNRSGQVEKFIQNYKEQISFIEEKITDQEPPKVLILMGIPGSYIVGTEHSYIGDLVKRAGGENAVTDRTEEYISANTEYLQQLEADVILRAAHGAPAEVIKMFDKEFAENDIWKHFTAVQNNRVYDLEETLFGTTANLAAIEALDELISILYEE